MNESVIRVKDLTKSFGSRRVVDGLSFDIRQGEVFALLGHNGAGKSTTIDLFLGLKAPDSGTAQIFGMDAARHRKQVFERVGVQLQHTQYQSFITVEEACMEYASLYSVPEDYRILLDNFPETTVAYMHTRLQSYDCLFDRMPQMGALMEDAGCVCALPEYCFTNYLEPGYRRGMAVGNSDSGAQRTTGAGIL